MQTSYSALKPILAAQDGGAVLPSADPTGGAGVYVPDAEAKALGLMSGTATGIDGYIGFNSEPYFDTNPNNRAASGMLDFTGIVLHEISEALGRRADGFSPAGAWTVALGSATSKGEAGAVSTITQRCASRPMDS